MYLTQHGWTQATIAATAGVHRTTVARICDGTYAQVRESTAKKILAVGVASRGSERQPAISTARRLRSLQAAGYSQSRLERCTGVDQTTISKLSLGKQRVVTTDIATRVDAVWVRLANRPVMPPTPQAVARRWPVPMAWNDIDDPDEEPGVTHCLRCDRPVRTHGMCQTCYSHEWYLGRREAANA